MAQSLPVILNEACEDPREFLMNVDVCMANPEVVPSILCEKALGTSKDHIGGMVITEKNRARPHVSFH